MNAIILNRSRIDLGKPHLAEEGHQMKPQADAVPFHPFGATLAFRDNGVLLLELLGGLSKCLFGFEQSSRELAPKPRYQPSAKALACSSPVSFVLVRYWQPFRDVEHCHVSPPRR
ncbi:hypothetical protein [Phyllobacterium sp. SB3]|uniref:hypothetical protein n=1 Tax=Phyllobacterium sp. SB3 TaxID=3156073 RepID=UPI0032AECFC0